MLSFEKRHRFLLGFVCVLSTCLSSCSNREEVFVGLLENDVVWRDQEGTIKILFQGVSTTYGYATMTICGQTKSAQAEFVASRYPEILFSEIIDWGEATTLNSYLSFEFVEVRNGGDIVFRTNYDFSNGTMLDRFYEIVLNKKAIEPDEYDMRHCVHGCWLSEDQSLFLHHDAFSPFTGKASGDYNGEPVSFTFLDDDSFKLEMDGALLGSGKYESISTGLNLIFKDGVGKKEFGENVHLGWATPSRVPWSI